MRLAVGKRGSFYARKEPEPNRASRDGYAIRLWQEGGMIRRGRRIHKSLLDLSIFTKTRRLKLGFRLRRTLARQIPHWPIATVELRIGFVRSGP